MPHTSHRRVSVCACVCLCVRVCVWLCARRCVFGVDASLTVQVSNSDNTLYVYYNFGAPTPPPVVDYDVVDYYSGRDRAPEPDSSVIVKPTV